MAGSRKLQLPRVNVQTLGSYITFYGFTLGSYVFILNLSSTLSLLSPFSTPSLSRLSLGAARRPRHAAAAPARNRRLRNSPFPSPLCGAARHPASYTKHRRWGRLAGWPWRQWCWGRRGWPMRTWRGWSASRHASCNRSPLTCATAFFIPTASATCSTTSSPPPASSYVHFFSF
jgi:hypothetical protein